MAPWITSCVTPCSLMKHYQCSKATCCLQIEHRYFLIITQPSYPTVQQSSDVRNEKQPNTTVQIECRAALSCLLMYGGAARTQSAMWPKAERREAYIRFNARPELWHGLPQGLGWTSEPFWTTWRSENSWHYRDSNSDPSVV
jgi:hypothetical protein